MTSLNLLLLTVILGCSASLRAQGFDRAYQLANDTLYTVDSLSESDDAYFVYLSQGQQTDQLTIDKRNGNQLSYGSYVPPPTPCSDTAGTAIGDNFFLRAKSVGSNRVLVERVERLGVCNSGELRVDRETIFEIPDVDTLDVGGVGFDRSSGVAYVVGGSATSLEPGSAFPFQNRQYMLGLDPATLELKQLSQSAGFGFFVPFLRTSISALKEGEGIYLRGYKDRQPSEGVFFAAFSADPAASIELYYDPSSGTCTFDAQQSFADYIEINSSEGCYGKCDAVQAITYLSPTRATLRLPTVFTCQGSIPRGASVTTKFPSPDTGIVFAGLIYGIDADRNQTFTPYFEKRGTSSDWRYEDDPSSTFSPDPVGLGTSDGGAIFVDTESGGVLRLRKFDTQGQLAEPRVDLAIRDLNVVDDTVQAGEVLFYDFELSNLGDKTATDEFIMLAYISQDTILDSTDIQEGRVLSGNFRFGQVEPQVPGASTLPQNLAPGNYTLFLVADARGVYAAEDDLTNNVLSAPFVVVGDGTINDGTVGGGTVGLTSLATFGISVGPNPTSGALSIRLPQNVAHDQPYLMLDVQGRMVRRGELRGSAETLDLGALPQGLYNLLLPELNATARIVKQ